MEEWKTIVDYPDYQVSNLGRVKSLKRNKELILNSKPDVYGYINVGLWKENELQMIRVHRLVALSFLPNPEDKPEVDHINRNKLDNSVSNLRWATRSENTLNRDYPIGSVGQKNISKNRDRFHVKLQRNNIIFEKYFYTLEEAIAYREEVLQTLQQNQ